MLKKLEEIQKIIPQKSIKWFYLIIQILLFRILYSGYLMIVSSHNLPSFFILLAFIIFLAFIIGKSYNFKKIAWTLNVALNLCLIVLFVANAVSSIKLYLNPNISFGFETIEVSKTEILYNLIMPFINRLVLSIVTLWLLMKSEILTAFEISPESKKKTIKIILLIMVLLTFRMALLLFTRDI